MQEQSSDKENRLSAEIRQTDEIAPAKGKCLHITPGSKGIDFNELLEQAVQCVNMGDILSKIHAGHNMWFRSQRNFNLRMSPAKCSSWKT